MTINVTIAKVVSSEFDANNQVFRRCLVGADGFGYQFVRPIKVDQQNQAIESAIAHDVRQCLDDKDAGASTVVPLCPKYDPHQAVVWLPEIHVARPTRHYWLGDRQQVQTRVIAETDEVYNLFTPIHLLPELIHALDTHEVKTRAEAYGVTAEVKMFDEPWVPLEPRPH